jgi:hypothetical protein
MTRWVKAGVVGLAFLSACGGLAGTAKEDDVSELLRTLAEAKQKGKVGSVEGFLYLFLPGPPTPLRDWPVRMIPLSPTLERAVTLSREQFARNGSIPLTAAALESARQPITDYLKRLEATGHKELIRRVNTETGTDPKFTFQDVPQGRWLLLAELPSKISVLLWAVPITVTEGQVTWQSLNDKSLWLEGVTAAE